MHPATNDSFAMYRLPHEEEAWFIKGHCSSAPTTLGKLVGKTAFVFSEFNRANQAHAIVTDKIERFDPTRAPVDYHFSDNRYARLTQAHYINIVNRAVDAMQPFDAGVSSHDFLRKVVLSRSRQVSLQRFEPTRVFEQLCQAYPAAFVYLLSSPVAGAWMGATPELLLEANHNKFKTVALAGTMPSASVHAWGDKERDEQRLVETYIDKILKVKQYPYTKTAPQSIVSGPIKHLYTRYSIDPPKGDIASSIDSLLSALNPTPAVCGMPLWPAIDFIEANEAYPRNLYSGFAGVVNQRDVHLFVNLRCMEWQNQTATLFAGAGITKHSNAEAELNETEIKMQAIGQFL